MQLNGVSSFTFKPTELVQLILGTNGSGKSSLLSELTPLPADPASYTKEGSKTIRITHRGESYVLRSTFSPKNQHSFIKGDDEELNPGHTITVQRELVRQIFGITPEIHELISGRDKFCDMSPSQRRVWFTLLSDISYDYALIVYQRLKDRARDTTGALKLAKKRLVTEQAKVISIEEERKLTKEVKDMSAELNLLQGQRAPVERPSASFKQEIHEGMEELTRMSMRLLRTRIVAPYGVHPNQMEVRDDWYELHRPGFQSVDDIETLIDGFRHDISVKEALINKSVGEHAKIKDTVRVLQRTGEEGVKALIDKRRALEARQAEVLEKRKLRLACENAPAMQNALLSVETLLVDVFGEIPENEDKRFSQSRLQEVSDLILRMKDTRQKKVSEVVYLNSQKAHMEAHKNSADLTCPKCSHKWIHGYSDEKFQILLEVISKEEDAVRLMERNIAEQEANAQAIRAYGELYRSYVRTVQAWPVLQPLWDHLMDNGYVTKSPRMALNVVAVYKQDLEIELEAAHIGQQIVDATELIRQAEQVGDASLSEQQLKLETVTLQIEELTSSLTRTQGQLADYSHWRRQLVESQELSAHVVALQSSLEKTNAQMIEALRLETLNHCIQQVRHSLVRKEETLSAVTLQKGIIADLEKNIASLTIQEDAAKALVHALSPTDGLIAEGLLGFIRSFTNQMNNQIRKIWTYPLQVKDCATAGSESAELDYRFPLMVQTKDNVVDDVSKGSTGMQEIVNLAFRVVAMRYLGLAESPLYLDEFGASFDVAHRSQATATVKALMEQQPFTQLFMVSHYEATHGAFSNAEVCVICPNNITIPASTKYNQHVSIH
jgi:energy-coupling factor transporter ATP-binding protein EcfA2